jgi:hypothetical protein
MSPQAIAGIANIGISALPLFFGENNIFSGKARQASRELGKTFQRSQSMGLPSEYNEYMQGLRTQANVGIPSAALGMYQQQIGRNQATQLAGLGSRRSALAGIGQIAQAGQDAALNLAGMQASALQQGQRELGRGLFQMGGLKYQDELRKLDEAKDYWGTRRQEANQAVSSALSNIGQAAGSALGMGAFNKIGGMPAAASAASQAQGFQLNQPSFQYTPYDFNQGATDIFKQPSLGYKYMGIKNQGTTSMYNQPTFGYNLKGLKK